MKKKKHQAGKKGIIFQKNGDGTVFHRLKQSTEESTPLQEKQENGRVGQSGRGSGTGYKGIVFGE